MAAHTKKHNIDATDDHNGVSGATENGILAFDANGLPKQPTTDIVVGQKLTSVTTPAADSDAATKGYVDGVAEGLKIKESARAASVGDNLTLSGEQTVDGVALVATDIILVMNQTTGSQNGLYVVAAGAWSRTDDLAVGADASGAFAFVEEGTINSDRGFVCTNNKGSDVVGTDDLTFTQFSGAGQITAGDGLTKTGDTINAVGGDGITANANDLAVALHVTNPGLEIDTATLRVKADGAHGIVRGASGVELEIEASKGLAVDADGLKTVIEASKGLTVGASGLAIVPDGTTGVTVAPLTLGANGAGVTVDNDTIGHTAGSLHVNEGGVILRDDVSLAGATPVRSDVSGWSDGDKGVGIGTDSSLWMIYKTDATHVFAVEMSEVGA